MNAPPSSAGWTRTSPVAASLAVMAKRERRPHEDRLADGALGQQLADAGVLGMVATHERFHQHDAGSAQAATIRSTSEARRLSGFSQRTCLPAAAALTSTRRGASSAARCRRRRSPDRPVAPRRSRRRGECPVQRRTRAPGRRRGPRRRRPALGADRTPGTKRRRAMFAALRMPQRNGRSATPFSLSLAVLAVTLRRTVVMTPAGPRVAGVVWRRLPYGRPRAPQFWTSSNRVGQARVCPRGTSSRRRAPSRQPDCCPLGLGHVVTRVGRRQQAVLASDAVRPPRS